MQLQSVRIARLPILVCTQFLCLYIFFNLLEKGHVLHMATPLGEPRPIMGVWGGSGAEPIHACEAAKYP